MQYHDLTPLEEIAEFPARALSPAREYSCTTIGQFRRIPDGTLLRSPNFGRKTLGELYDMGLISAGRETIDVAAIFQDLRDKKKRHERIVQRRAASQAQKEMFDIMSSNLAGSKRRISSYSDAVRHWNIYGMWPDGSLDPDGAHKFVDDEARGSAAD